MNNPFIPPLPPALTPPQQGQAAAYIATARARLLADDPELLPDILDGESDAIRGLIRASTDAELFAESARTRQAELAAGAECAERRRLAFWSAALALMEIAGRFLAGAGSSANSPPFRCHWRWTKGDQDRPRVQPIPDILK